MILIVLLVGIVLITVAIRNSQGDLFNALKTDVPAFGIWAAAIIAIGAIGVVPEMRPVSRGILALVIVVIIVNNYQALVSGFKGAASGAASAGTNASGSTSSISGGTSGLVTGAINGTANLLGVSGANSAGANSDALNNLSYAFGLGL